MIAQTAVAAAVFAIDRPYSYRIPADLAVRPGVRVMVPFGRGNRRTEAIVLQIEDGAGEDLKCIDRVLDSEAVLDDAALRLAAFLRERYFCTYYEAVRAILPAGLWYQTVDRFSILPDRDWRAAIKRQPLAVQVMERLEELGGSAEYPWLRRQFPDEAALRDALRYLLGKHLVENRSEMFRRASDKTERLACLAVPAEEAAAWAASRRRSAPVQASVLDLLCVMGSGSTKELCYFTGATGATLRRMESMGLLELKEVPTLRRVTVRPGPAEPFTLNAMQQAAYDGLCAQMDSEKPGGAVLYGVTGSGKTLVYLRLIARCLERGRSAVLLVPEIGLTPQLVRLLAAHFGDLVAVLHSRLRVGERYDEWKRIRAGEARVVVGTRSAVFAPARDLGLVIVDEEQEHTYKSENAPRYHAREVALYRGLRERALVVLGSATPSVETMYQAQTGVWPLYRLPERYNGRQLPPVEIVDMKEELRSGNGSAISAPLAEALRQTVEDGHQAILFLNRRGASRLLVCVQCGDVAQCPRCSVHMTYHAANHRLMCHYCGHSEPVPEACPKCGGPLKLVGFGTQRVEEQLRELLPGREILRMDADTVSAVHSHEQLLERFEKERIPVLVGTQMVAKGLNFPNVTLVGVLDADMSLYTESFRAAETTFSMLTQVVGRSGRGSEEGTAMIQTMTPDNPVIRLAARQDYDRFYGMESALRQLRGCPPFRSLAAIHFSGLLEERVAAGARRFRELLVAQLTRPGAPAMTVLGPAPATVARVNNRFRYRLTLSFRNSRQIRRMIAELLRTFAADGRARGVTAFVDTNPYD